MAIFSPRCFMAIRSLVVTRLRPEPPGRPGALVELGPPEPIDPLEPLVSLNRFSTR